MTNIYDDQSFFKQYAQMSRSRQGLPGAGEWKQFKAMFPDLNGKTVLDLGCGYGWHCRYAVDCGAEQVTGIDSSKRMIAEANQKNADPKIAYSVCGLESFSYPSESFDCVLSNLVLHYVEDLDSIFNKVYSALTPGGVFLLNIEHPVFTAGVNQTWVNDASGQPEHWPVDNYFYPGERTTGFLGHAVKKQHHTLTQILMGLRHAGFCLDVVEEAMPDSGSLNQPGMRDEMRRPMMLLVKSVKPLS